MTLTLGARYERPSAGAAGGQFRFPADGPVLHWGTLNLAPRIGLAYRLNDKTVIRAGGGTFFARMISGIFDDNLTGNGIYQTADSLMQRRLVASAGPKFPNALAGAGIEHRPGRFHAGCMSPKLKTPYSEQAQVAVERQLSKDLVLTVSGIFSRGVSLYGAQDINAGPLGAPFTYSIADAPANFPSSYTTQVYSGTAARIRLSAPSRG